MCYSHLRCQFNELTSLVLVLTHDRSSWNMSEVRHFLRIIRGAPRRLGNVPFVDATGIFALEQILADFKRHGAAVLFTEVRPNVFYKLERSGLIDLFGRENVFESLNDAVARAEQGLPRAARDDTVHHL